MAQARLQAARLGGPLLYWGSPHPRPLGFRLGIQNGLGLGPSGAWNKDISGFVHM